MKTIALSGAALLLLSGAAIASPIFAGTTLSTIKSPSNLIASANVRDASGRIIGAVQRVNLMPDGTPTKVSVALIGKNERMVVLDAGAVKYDPSKNEIRAGASRSQMLAQNG